MKVSENCKKIIKEFEGCKLIAYVCPSGKWTIGYGHTGSDVYYGLKIKQGLANKLLDQDLLARSRDVSNLLKIAVSQNQFDALVSLEFNIGYGNFKNSSILRCVNAGDFKKAAWHFYHENQGTQKLEEKYKGCWVFDSYKKVLPGLVRRRKVERDLFIL